MLALILIRSFIFITVHKPLSNEKKDKELTKY